MKELNKLANEIVSELVDCGAADEEPVEQYKKWTLQRLEKAFRALEQRAEAAEAKLTELESSIHQLGRKQGVAAMQSAQLVIAALSERHAPAVSLAELVPDDFSAIRLQKARLWIDRVLMDKPGMKEAQTVSAILRNIEEAKQ